MCSQFLPVVQPSSCFDLETAANLTQVKNSVDKTSGEIYIKIHICLLPKLIINDRERFNMQTANDHVCICLNWCKLTCMRGALRAGSSSREAGGSVGMVCAFLSDPFRLQSHICFKSIHVCAAADSIPPHPSHILPSLGLGRLLVEL